MSVTLQIILSIACIALLVNADRIILKVLEGLPRLTYTINRFLLRKSYKAAMADAKLLKANGSKVYLLLWAGNWEAMPKQNFKTMWHKRPGMKKYSVQHWERKMIEV